MNGTLSPSATFSSSSDTATREGRIRPTYSWPLQWLLVKLDFIPVHLDQIHNALAAVNHHAQRMYLPMGVSGRRLQVVRSFYKSRLSHAGSPNDRNIDILGRHLQPKAVSTRVRARHPTTTTTTHVTGFDDRLLIPRRELASQVLKAPRRESQTVGSSWWRGSSCWWGSSKLSWAGSAERSRFVYRRAIGFNTGGSVGIV